MNKPADSHTAAAFATSWNNLPEGSIYTRDQFEDWMAPLARHDFEGKAVLELGCGNGSLLVHACVWGPASIVGVDLGESVVSARRNLVKTGFHRWQVIQEDLSEYRGKGFDLVYCVGVLHHLKDPGKGFASVVANTEPGGRFHCWVYAHEGNAPVRMFVEPMRRMVSSFPWWVTKFGIATPLSVPLYLYAKALRLLRRLTWVRNLPMAEYCIWLAKREIAFVRHIIFDQLVTPETKYLRRDLIESWLAGTEGIDQSSTYIVSRNGNSWKFGGRKSA